MIDPKRWLEDPGPSASLEARVLDVALEERVPAGLEDRAWADFLLRVGPGAGGLREPHEPTVDTANTVEGGHGGALEGLSSSVGTSLAVGVIKATGAGVLLGVLTMSGVHALKSESVSRVPSGVTASPASSLAPGRVSASEPSRSSFPTSRVAESEALGVVPGKTGLRVREASGPPVVGASQAMQAFPSDRGHAPRESSASEAGAHITRTDAPRAAFPVVSGGESAALGASPAARTPATDSELKAEALELAQAKNLLQQGRAGEAEALLVRGSRRFANGALSGERELLTVQALSHLGRGAEAHQRAQAFLARHPGTPISARMQRLLSQQ